MTNYLRVNSNQEVEKALKKAKAFMKTGLFKTRMMSMKISEGEPYLKGPLCLIIGATEMLSGLGSF